MATATEIIKTILSTLHNSLVQITMEQQQQSDNSEKISPPKSRDNSFNSDELKPYSPTFFRPANPPETVNFELDDSTGSYCNFDDTTDSSINWEEFSINTSDEFTCEGSCCHSTRSASFNGVISSPCSATSQNISNDSSLQDESYFIQVYIISYRYISYRYIT